MHRGAFMGQVGTKMGGGTCMGRTNLMGQTIGKNVDIMHKMRWQCSDFETGNAITKNHIFMGAIIRNFYSRSSQKWWCYGSSRIIAPFMT